MLQIDGLRQYQIVHSAQNKLEVKLSAERVGISKLFGGKQYLHSVACLSREAAKIPFR